MNHVYEYVSDFDKGFAEDFARVHFQLLIGVAEVNLFIEDLLAFVLDYTLRGLLLVVENILVTHYKLLYVQSCNQ